MAAAVAAASFCTSAASAFKPSSARTTRSSSRMDPLPCTALSSFSRPSSSSRSRTLCSPCSRSASLRRRSTSGRSARSTMESACAESDAGVTVKLTKVTREQRSGGSAAPGSRVTSTSANCGEKSTSSFPTRTVVRPPVRCTSWLSSGFSTGSTRSTSSMTSGVPKRTALASVLRKPASRKLVVCTLRPAYCASRKRVAWPVGSTTKG